MTFSEDELQDPLFLVSVFTGGLVSSRVLPLIWDSDTTPATKVRSLPFLRKATHQVLQTLSDEERSLFNVGLRDLAFAASCKLLSEADLCTFRNVVALVTEEQPLLDIQGLRVSYYPSSDFKLVRFFESDADSELLAHVGGMRMGFVNARELNFRVLENIIPLDRAFGDLSSLKVSANTALSKGVFSCQLSNASDLLRLDELGFYSVPPNAASRGGTRFVFSSATLAAALTQSLRKGAKLAWLDKTFVSVNSVFRMNRFEGGDSKGFDEHMDAPYYGSERSLFSYVVFLTFLFLHTQRQAARTRVALFAAHLFDGRPPPRRRAGLPGRLLAERNRADDSGAL